MALHGGLFPYGGTFFVFSDYMRPSLRLAALIGAPAIYVFTHDSDGLGEDGPTHQPIEQLASLRAIPNLHVIRPGDANETVEAWRVAARAREGPTALVLTRQKLPCSTGGTRRGGAARGALRALGLAGGEPRLILMATGSEVRSRSGRRKLLAAEGIPARVVSMPSWELFRTERDVAGARPAAGGAGARRVRGGRDARLGAVRGADGGGRRPRPLRRLRALPDDLPRARADRRERGARGEGGGRRLRPRADPARRASVEGEPELGRAEGSAGLRRGRHRLGGGLRGGLGAGAPFGAASIVPSATTISTRRFFARPSAVSFGETGFPGPYPRRPSASRRSRAA